MFNEDLDAFFSEDEFAVRARVTRASGMPHPDVVGVFDDPYLNAQLGEYELDTTVPRFTAPWARICTLVPGDRIVIGADHFQLTSHPQRDGTGIGLLKLAPEEPDDA